MRAVVGPGRWVWGVSGLVTAAALAIPGARLITSPGYAGENIYSVTTTETVPQPVTSLVVQSYGGQIQVTSAHVDRVHVTEMISYDQGTEPAPVVAQSVSGGRLSLSDPTCAHSDCNVDFDVTVPADVTVTASTGGGPLAVSGTAGANLASSGGPMRATLIGGPLTVNSGGGPLVVQGLSAATATITTGGGSAMVSFATAPEKVSVGTDGGPATVIVPGGPYNLTANSGGGSQSVRIATDPTALPSITITSGGGSLQVEPPGGAG
jgi:hypothetical protein